MHINCYYYILLQINVIRAAHIALHTLYFREIIYLPFYLQCFFLCLLFKQKIGPQPQLPNVPDDDDDDTSVPSSTPEPGPHIASSSSTSAAAAAAAAVSSTSACGVFSKSAKKKVRTPARDSDIVQLLLQHQERSQAVAGELHQLITQAAVPTNNKSAWATFLHSNLPLVHDRVCPLYLKMSMENYLWALNESETIRSSFHFLNSFSHLISFKFLSSSNTSSYQLPSIQHRLCLQLGLTR